MPSNEMDRQAALRKKLAQRKASMMQQRSGAGPSQGLAKVSRSLDDDVPARVRRPVRATSPPSPSKLVRLADAHSLADPAGPQASSNLMTRSVGSLPRAQTPEETGAHASIHLERDLRRPQSPPITPVKPESPGLAIDTAPVGPVETAASTTAETVAAAVASTAGSAACAALGVASAAAKAAGCPLERQSSRIERMEMLQEVVLFSGVASERMLEIADSLVTKTVEAGEFVVKQGEVGDEMYVVEVGRLHATLELPDGSSAGVVAEYGRGHFFGELALLEDVARAASIMATERSRLLVLRRDAVLETLQASGLYCTLRSVPMFAELDNRKLHQIGTKLVKRTFGAGQVVIEQGDGGDEMFVVESGRLEASIITAEGKDIGVVKTYAGGEYFGELALIDNTPRAATITAVDESVLFVLRRECVAEALKDQAMAPRAGGRRNTYKLSEVIAYEEIREHYCCGAPGVVIAPDTPFCRIKDAVMTTLILFSCFWEPYKAAFAEDDVQTTTLEQVVNAIYWADIVSKN